MSVEELLNHTATRYRYSEAKGTNNAIVRTWTATGATGIPVAIQELDESTQDDGGGERTVGRYRYFAAVGADITEGDILEITGGPGSYGYLWVDSAYKPRNNHLQGRLHATREDPTT